MQNNSPQLHLLRVEKNNNPLQKKKKKKKSQKIKQSTILINKYQINENNKKYITSISHCLTLI